MSRSASLKRATDALPLFRCSRGWRRGAVKISIRMAESLVAEGLARRTTTAKGAPMLVAVKPTGAERPAPEQPSVPQGGAEGANGERRWWQD